mmetsp:Transcript_430/g.1956  ORF Transcript_430/g.1956 Transcript_430/m.1956 type:complete len:223 (-) Transcript_430:1151-1819(-)
MTRCDEKRTSDEKLSIRKLRSEDMESSVTTSATSARRLLSTTMSLPRMSTIASLSTPNLLRSALLCAPGAAKKRQILTISCGTLSWSQVKQPLTQCATEPNPPEASSKSTPKLQASADVAGNSLASLPTSGATKGSSRPRAPLLLFRLLVAFSALSKPESVYLWPDSASGEGGTCDSKWLGDGLPRPQPKGALGLASPEKSAELTKTVSRETALWQTFLPWQ